MKRMKKLASLFLAMVMVLSMTVAAFADGTTYSITVKKQEGTSVSLAGNTYYAYKLLNVTYNTDRDAYAYTIADEFKNFTYVLDGKTYSEIKDDAGHNVNDSLIAYIQGLGNDSAALNAVAEKVLKYVEDNDIKEAGKVVAESDTAVIDLTEAGYYLVAGTATADGNKTVTAACALNTAAPTAEVNVKADAPKLEKKIIENNVPVDANNAAIGDTVNYQIKSQVPKMTGYEKYYFVVKDTMSAGLTFNPTANDPEVEPDLVGNPNITIDGKTLTYGKDYTVEVKQEAESDPTEITIIFNNFIQYNTDAFAGKDIVIDYTAVINGNAKIGNDGNDNVAKLQYSNNPNVIPDGDPENPDKPGEVIGETPEDKVITYVTGIELTKIDANGGDRLVGAEFEISGEKINKVKVLKDVFTVADDGTYYALKDGTYTEKAPEEGTKDKYVDETTKYKKELVVEWNEETERVSATGVVGSDGVLRFDGLAEGTYEIEEAVAPDGYNKLVDPITVVITCKEPDDVDAVDAKAEWTYTANGNGLNITDGTLNNDGRIAFNVANNKGSLLPSTGGIGRTIFYAAGIILMAGAMFFVVRRKRA